jgi:hypothetical protein
MVADSIAPMGVQLTKESSVAQFPKTIFGGVHSGTNPPLHDGNFEQSVLSPISGIAMMSSPAKTKGYPARSEGGTPAS